MSPALTTTLLALGSAGFFAFALVVAAALSVKAAAVLMPGLAIGAMLALRPFWGLLLLILFAQLDAVANTISQFLPISLYKLLTVAVVGGVALQSWSVPRQERLGPRAVQLRYAVLFAIWMFISLLLAEHRGAAVSHMFGFISVMTLYWLSIILINTPKRLEICVWVLVASGLFSGVVVLVDSLLGIRLLSTAEAATTASFDGVARSAGASDYNPTTAAHMLLSTTVLAGVMLCGTQRLWPLTVAALAIGIAALVLTFARSAAIAFAVVAVIFAWANRRSQLFPIGMMSVLLAAVAALPFVPDLFWERMGTLLNIEVDRTLLRRVSYNQIGLELLGTHPVFGVGPGNFPLHYIESDFRWYPGRIPVPRQLHNSYLEVAVEMGLVGLACFLAVMFSSLRGAIAAMASPVVSAPARALAYAFGAFLIASVFMPNEDTKFMWILPGLCVAAMIIGAREREVTKRNPAEVK